MGGCGLIWQGVGACDKAYGHLAGGGVGRCYRVWGHVVGGGDM